MNSMSKGHCHEEKEVCCKKEKEVCFRKEEREEGTHVILKCGTPGSVALPILALGTIFAPTSFTLSTVTVDTSEFKDPCIKFEVASTVNTTVAIGLPFALNYQIFRNCKNQFTPIPVGPIFTFSRAVSIVESNAFSFFVCDCDVCPDDCCTYSLVITNTALAIAEIASITNATISALVVENDRC